MHQGIAGTPVEHYLQILVHDHDATFYHYGGEHQECLAHILRYLQDAIDNEPELTWHKQMKLASEEYEQHPPSKYFPEGFNLFKRMVAYKKNHLLFLSHPEIEYTNNRAERGLRKFKRKLKQAVTFRCNHSIEDLCDCLSIMDYFFHEFDDIDDDYFGEEGFYIF